MRRRKGWRDIEGCIEGWNEENEDIIIYEGCLGFAWLCESMEHLAKVDITA